MIRRLSVGLVTSTPALGGLFALIWSLSFVATKLALEHVPPVTLASLRLVLAGAVVLILRPVRTLRMLNSMDVRVRWKIAGAGLLSQAVYLSASYWALGNLPTSVVNIVVSTLPLITIPISFMVLRERVRILDLVAFVLSIIGVVFTLSPVIDTSPTQFADIDMSAVVLMVSVVSLALGNVLMKPLVSSSSLFAIFAIQFTFAGIASFVLSLVLEPFPDLTGIAGSGGYIVFLALIGSVLGTAAWFRILRELPANAASSFFLLTPLFGVLFGLAVFGEPIDGGKIVGVLVISASIALRARDSLPGLFARIVPRAGRDRR